MYEICDMKYKVSDVRTVAAARAIFDEIMREILALAPAYYSRTEQCARRDPNNPDVIFVHSPACIVMDLVHISNTRIYSYEGGNFVHSLNDLFKDLHHLRLALLKEMLTLEQVDEEKMKRLIREIDTFCLEAQVWEREGFHPLDSLS